MLRIRTNRETQATFVLPFSMRRTPREVLKPSLLIVDDDTQVLRVSVRLLSSLYTIEAANDPLEAAYLLRHRRFDAILTDYEMPGENGLWVLEIARKYHPDARRVLFSGSGPENIAMYTASGLVHSFIAKPSSRDALIAALGNAEMPSAN